MARLSLALGLFFLSLAAHAYPHFIGYKYSSCVTCHYNTQGNGPLNDYGRALWATEIAGRFGAGKKTAEQLGMSSGFLGSTELPYWIRPGVKARQLWVQTNPGRANSRERNITMQADANVAVSFDPDQKYVFVGSIGYVPEPLRLQNSPQEVDEWISREHYFRWQATESLWLSFGMMDKVYGIRHANHTAYSRSRVGLAQNDQAHGVLVHYIQPEWEYSLHLFAGNLNQTSGLRQEGASTLFEYDVQDFLRLGVSALYSTNDSVRNQRLGLHAKYGLGMGSALLFEVGLIDDTPEVGTARQGYYLYSEAIQKVVRGYHIFVTGQAYKDDMSGARPDNMKIGAGLLAFPLQRWECRLEVENTRQINSSQQVPKDVWAILAQLHISL